MTTRAVLVLALLLAPLPAAATGFGVTLALGGEQTSGGAFGPVSVGGLLIQRMPTLDIVADAVMVQIHALDLLRSLGDEHFFLGANLHFTVGYHDVTETLQGIIAPGGSFDLDTDFDFNDTMIQILGLLRLGIETKGETMRVGLYVVPGAGFADLSGELEVAVSGTLQASVWLH